MHNAVVQRIGRFRDTPIGGDAYRCNGRNSLEAPSCVIPIAKGPADRQGGLRPGGAGPAEPSRRLYVASTAFLRRAASSSTVGDQTLRSAFDHALEHRSGRGRDCITHCNS